VLIIFVYSIPTSADPKMLKVKNWKETAEGNLKRLG
jgi:hypothetical protein